MLFLNLWALQWGGVGGKEMKSVFAYNSYCVCLCTRRNCHLQNKRNNTTTSWCYLHLMYLQRKYSLEILKNTLLPPSGHISYFYRNKVQNWHCLRKTTTTTNGMQCLYIRLRISELGGTIKLRTLKFRILE